MALSATLVTITGRERVGGLTHVYGTIALDQPVAPATEVSASVRVAMKNVLHASLAPKTQIAAAVYVNLPHWAVGTDAAGTADKVTWTFQDLGADCYFSFEIVGVD